MALFRLFVDSATGVDIDPTFDFTESGAKMETVHRTLEGKEFRYLYGEYKIIKFTMEYVNSSFMATVNSWWATNANLKFMEVSDPASVRQVRLVNKKTPVDKNMPPYRDYFKGSFELETY